MYMLLILSVLVSFIVMGDADRSTPAPFAGRYTGTSAFSSTDPADAGYAETIPVWFVFESEDYVYGEGDTIPEELAGDGGGPYEWTDSTVSLNGAYPKILRPAVVLKGSFAWRLEGDTLTLMQPGGSTPGTGRHLRLVRHGNSR